MKVFKLSRQFQSISESLFKFSIIQKVVKNAIVVWTNEISFKNIYFLSPVPAKIMHIF